MNKTTLTILLAATLITSPVLGGIVEFRQPNWLADVAHEPVTYELTILVEELDAFDTADILIGSDDLTIVGFEYSAEWIDTFDVVYSPRPIGVYEASDLFVGGFTSNAVAGPLTLGDLTVFSPLVDLGKYTIGVDGALDGVSFLYDASSMETLNGYGVAYAHIPEPASLTMVAIGAVVLLHRRNAGKPHCS